LVNLKQNKRG